MRAPAEIRYVSVDDGIDIAYLVFGEGPDLLVAPGFVTHLDLNWELAPYQRLLPLARKFRLILFDRRGTGLSDRSLGIGTLEDRTEDICAVLDAVGSERVILHATSEAGPMAAYYAAMYPRRVKALILAGTYRSLLPEILGSSKRAAGTWVGQALARGVEATVDLVAEQWGRGETYMKFVSNAPDPATAQEVLARFERIACSPQMVREVVQALNAELCAVSAFERPHGVRPGRQARGFWSPASTASHESEPRTEVAGPIRQLSRDDDRGLPQPVHDPRPGFPGVFFAMPLGGERTTAWIADCIRHLRERGLGAVEATEDAEASWDREINEIADRTLYPLTNSWYTGANIPGKPRQFLGHLRGSQYFDRLSEVAEGGYEGFAFEPVRREDTCASFSEP